MAFAAAIPLIASLIPAIGSLFGGGSGDKGGGGGGGDQGLAATHAALGTVLANKDTQSAEHPVLKGTDLPPILAHAMTSGKSGHVLPHAATASGKMGHPGVLAPHLEQALTDAHTRQQSAPILRHQEKSARAAVRRVQAQVQPHLETLRKQMADRATQVQATAEHRAIVQRDQRWRDLTNQNEQMISALNKLNRSLKGRWLAG